MPDKIGLDALEVRLMILSIDAEKVVGSGSLSKMESFECSPCGV